VSTVEEHRFYLPGSSELPERRLRVLHVIGGLGPGGAETLLYRLATRGGGVDHQIICLGPRDWYSSRLEQQGISVEHLDMSSLGRGLSGTLRLRRLIRRSRADVVQAWMYRSNLLAGVHARSAGIPVVWGVHCSSLDPLGPAARLWVYTSGMLARWVPSFIINCSSRSAELHQRLGFDSAPNAVVHNGYDPDAFTADDRARARLRDDFGFTERDFVVASIARWHPQKDIPTLLRAVRMVRERGLPVHCLLVGHDLDQANPQLAELIEQTKAKNFVLPLGRRSDIRELACAMDLHVLASMGGEAFPNAVAETMLCETPNLVTDVGDAPFMVEGSGWVVSPRRPDELAGAIHEAYEEWQDTPARWAERRAAARARIATNFTLDKMAEAYEEIWRRVAGKDAAQRTDMAPARQGRG